VFHRQELDAYLAEQARQGGAAIRENETVTAFQVDEQGVTVTTSRSTYRARVLVAADGSKGIVRQTLMRQEPSPARQGGRRQRVARLLETLCTAGEASPLFAEQAAEFDFTPADDGLQGYCWDFPSWVEGERHINRGIYDARVAASRLRPNLPALLDAYLENRIAEDERPVIEGHPIHWFSPRERFAWPRLLLTGDAAGVDPLFGEGIGPALGYGQVAAQSLQAAFASGDFSFQDYRQRLKESAVGRYLMTRWVAAEGAYRFSHQRLFMHLVWTLGDVAARLWPELPALY
jgi:flavin-dependent dehydrogenase